MTAGLRLWSCDEEGTCFVDEVYSSSPCPWFSPRLNRPGWLASLELLWHLEGVIWSMCARASAFVVSQERQLQRENLYTHRVRETSVCLERWACLPLRVCLCGHRRERERESCVSPWEIKPGHSIHRKTLISPFDKKGIESLFRSQPPTEKTAGECYTQVSQHRFRSVSPRTNIPIAVISCYLQSNIYPIQNH